MEDLAESLRVTFATTGSLSDPRRPERLCASGGTRRDTPGVLRAELDRVVFADDPKASVTTARNYLSMLVHATSDVVRSHVCVACAESEDPWWLPSPTNVGAFDERVSGSPTTIRSPHPGSSTPWSATTRTPKPGSTPSASTRRRARRKSGENRNIGRAAEATRQGAVVAQTLVTETKNALESACGLSRTDWRSYFVKRVIAPALDDFLDECEARAVGSRGLGALVASTGAGGRVRTARRPSRPP